VKAADRVNFGGGGLDRQACRRPHAGELLKSDAARVLALWRGRPLVTGGRDAVKLAFVAPDHPLLADHGGELVFLGAANGQLLFARDVSGWNPNSTTARDAGPGRAGDDEPIGPISGLPDDARFADLRPLITGLDPLDAEIAVTAKGILEWHRTHQFCAACGAPSELAEGGWQRRCLACERRHFPRTDPVVIMLVTRGNAVLVGRSPGWPEGFYSLLAGFMEPGETVSAAVRREVAEETHVQVGKVRMLASQPWPFPASLMIGCLAMADSAEITLDPAELDDALWLSREEMLSVFAGTHPTVSTPRKGAIAHFILKMWLADRLD